MILQQPFAISGATGIPGFGYYTPFTIATGQVPSTQTDFPILISVTDNRFKTVGNGGHVQDANGYDIRPYSDLTTAITGYELEFYDGTAGTVAMWIKRSSVADALVTNLAYGNASLNTDGSSTTTWSNSFLSAMHYGNGTTLSTVDSVTGTTTFNPTGTPTAVAGQIDGAAGLASASSQYFETPGNGPVAVAMTLSAWIKGTTFPSDYNSVMNRGQSSVDRYGIFVKSTGKLYCVIAATTTVFYDGSGSHTLSTGTWYHVAFTYDSTSGMVGYVNGASDQTIGASGNANTTGNAAAIGRQRSTGTRYWNGSIDEVRFASVARSADWITTEYNNQSAPGTFLTMGTEV